VILLVTHFSQKEISYPKKIWIALVEILIFVMLLKTSIMSLLFYPAMIALFYI